ncbi:MAG: putative ral stress protein 26 [Panacagrimonas sp.]|jgi:general stress protein 26|nr:pyridoxamine 5'-phosphate oxidase family protein [Panacagrimonas sp.]MCC2658069.1 putative ral stress protein 26 [Panacagrimonas sp.]
MTASTQANGDHTRQELMTRLRDLIQHIQTAQLVTMDTDGVMRGRPMATQPLGEDEESELWFFTREYSAKVDNVLAHPEVCVTYADPANNSYVSVSGKAELVRDRDKIEKLWRPVLKAWFPEGVDDPDLALLRVDIVSAQYWDATSSKLVQLFGLIKALATGQSAGDTIGENEKVEVRQRIGSDTAT